MIPAHALTTNQARPAHPSEPDLDSDAKMCYGFTHLVDGNKHFVSWDDRIRRQPHSLSNMLRSLWPIPQYWTLMLISSGMSLPGSY